MDRTDNTRPPAGTVPATTGSHTPPQIEIDGALVARSLGLEVARFRELMAQRKVAILCERGTGQDAGLYRATFYYGKRRLRLIVDEQGKPVPGASDRS